MLKSHQSIHDHPTLRHLIAWLSPPHWPRPLRWSRPPAQRRRPRNAPLRPWFVGCKVDWSSFWWLFYVILTGFHGGSMGIDGDVMLIEICHNISPSLCPASKKKKTKSYGSTLGHQWTHRCVTVNLTPCTLWRYIHSWPIWNLKKKKSEFTISPVTTIFHQTQEKTKFRCFPSHSFERRWGVACRPLSEDRRWHSAPPGTQLHLRPLCPPGDRSRFWRFWKYWLTSMVSIG